MKLSLIRFASWMTAQGFYVLHREGGHTGKIKRQPKKTRGTSSCITFSWLHNPKEIIKLNHARFDINGLAILCACMANVSYMHKLVFFRGQCRRTIMNMSQDKVHFKQNKASHTLGWLTSAN